MEQTNNVHVVEAGFDWNDLGSWDALESVIDKKDDNTLINQIDHFSDVVLKKTKPKVTGKDGLISLKIF